MDVFTIQGKLRRLKRVIAFIGIIVCLISFMIDHFCGHKSTDNPSVNSVNGFTYMSAKLYEGPKEGICYGERKYETTFAKDTSRYIFTEVNFVNPNHLNGDSNLNLDVEYFYPDGSRLTAMKETVVVKKDWSHPYHCVGWGSTSLGKVWKMAGTYTVNIYFEDTLVGKSTFIIK